MCLDGLWRTTWRKAVFCRAHPTDFYICWSLCSKHLISLYVWKKFFTFQVLLNLQLALDILRLKLSSILSPEGSSWYMIISCVWIFSDEDDFQSLHLLFVVLVFNHCGIILPSRQGGLSSLNINWNRSRCILLWKSTLPSHRFRRDPIHLWNQSFSYKESFLWWLGLVHHSKLRSTDGGVQTSWPMRTTITHLQVTS